MECQVIGCAPQEANVWLPQEGIFACVRCATELIALRQERWGQVPLTLTTLAYGLDLDDDQANFR
jgi:hypothetical protein